MEQWTQRCGLLLLREKDRVEYARYVLTGHIFPMGAKEITSSPTFLDPPDSAEVLYVKAQVESIFCAVDLAGHLDFDDLLSVTLGKFSSTTWRT